MYLSFMSIYFPFSLGKTASKKTGNQHAKDGSHTGSQAHYCRNFLPDRVPANQCEMRPEFYFFLVLGKCCLFKG